jgi:Trk K+ transport system NAD-binding subunit
MNKPVVLCGLGKMGSRVLEYLQAAGLPVVVVDTNCRPDDPRLRGARLVSGDCRRRDVLEQAGTAQARGVLILTSDDLISITTMLVVRSLSPDVRVVLRLFNQNLIDRLGQAFKNVHALSTSRLTAPILAMTAMTGQGLGTFRLHGQPDGRRQIAEVTIAASSELRGRSLVEVARPRDALVLAHLPAGGAARYLLDVDLEARLQGGDRLVVCGEPHSLRPLFVAAGEGDLNDLRWAGRLRRTSRVVWRTLSQLDRMVVICTLVLLAVVLISTVVLHASVQKYKVADALFHTIGIIATGGALGEDFHTEGIKVFVSILRIFGAAVTAAFTAIVTNYLLRARLRGALEVSRIPEGGHFVVVGLTPVGFRVLEELVGSGEPVVVIDKDADNRFVTTARRLGAAVLVGDAAVGEVLRQAHAGSARAVVAATNNDMVNLEVALLARELNARQRVVLLISEPQLAQMLRDEANVRMAVSVPALAAPAFLAGLVGDRVQSVFLVRERLLVVVDLVMQERDPLLNQTVRAVAVDYQLLPAAVIPAAGPMPEHPFSARLGPGDRLVAIIALPNLDRLLRRQPSSAGYAVDVTAFPLPTRDWLAWMVRTVRGVGASEAEAALAHLPLRLGENLTRGQAEDLLAQLVRERVTGMVCAMSWDGAAPDQRPPG